MSQSTSNNLKLGIFVVAGILFLILLLYMIGKSSNLFRSNFPLKTHFNNAQGLEAGNNVLFAGTQIGTVKKVQILNDTTIEILFYIDKNSKDFIHKNSLTSVSTEGVVGNKVLSITNPETLGAPVQKNDILPARETHSLEAMLETLNSTNNNIAFISEELKKAVVRLNDSSQIWQLLESKELADNVRHSLANIQSASAKAVNMMNDVNVIVADVKSGKGSLGTLLRDSAFANNMDNAAENIQQFTIKMKEIGDQANQVTNELNKTAQNIQQSIHSGDGVVHTLLYDTAFTNQLNTTLDNIEKGTEAFHEDMEALQHNFLLRGYFKKKARREKKEKGN